MLCARFSVLLLHSVAKEGKKYYPQILLEKCKYAIKMENIMNDINEELNSNNSDSDKPDEENNEN